ncbi:MAG: glycosyltransferase family 2 protein, partial [Bacteroidales bacterium]|nr:glycosyltransferase family 2 protein [Bacteroidales bacterium]
EESLKELIDWIDRVMKANHYSYECIMIDDGSNDNSWKIIQELKKEHPEIEGIKFMKNNGKSAAMYCGFEAARGDVVITLDADLQDSPEEIPGLYKMIKEEGYDLVSGWKKKRHDPISKTIPSKFYNWTARRVTGIYLHDMNCGLKAYRNKVVKSIEVFGDMHRYIPVLAKSAGFRKIGEKVVSHQARKYGVSKFGISRLITGYLDLLTVVFISKFGKRPMHFFGTIGSLFFFIGFVILMYLTYAKFVFHQYQMTSRPLFFLGLLAIIFGTQLFLTGFIAELTTRSSSDRNVYQIEERV